MKSNCKEKDYIKITLTYFAIDIMLSEFIIPQRKNSCFLWGV